MKVLEGLPNSQRIEFWTIVSSNVLTIIILFTAILIISFRKKYKWLIGMLCMMIIADLGIIGTNLGYVLQHNQVYTEDHLLSLKVMIGIGNFVYNFFLNLVHWLFGFEYWYISIEVPRIQKEKPRAITEMQFNIIKYVGVALNFIVCLVLGYYEWTLQEAIFDLFKSGTTLPQSLIDTILIWEYVVILFIVFSICFLIAGLTKI